MALDPNMQMFQGYLGRESTIVKNNLYVKDFSYLGRPIKEVVYLDFTDETVPDHGANLILLPEWTGDMSDRSLYELVPFLESKLKPKVITLNLYLSRFGSEAMRRERGDRQLRTRRHCSEVQRSAAATVEVHPTAARVRHVWSGYEHRPPRGPANRCAKGSHGGRRNKQVDGLKFWNEMRKNKQNFAIYYLFYVEKLRHN